MPKTSQEHHEHQKDGWCYEAGDWSLSRGVPPAVDNLQLKSGDISRKTGLRVGVQVLLRSIKSFGCLHRRGYRPA
jgi:hypothetical protein